MTTAGVALIAAGTSHIARLSTSAPATDPAVQAAWIGFRATVIGVVGALLGALLGAVIVAWSTRKANDRAVAAGATSTMATLSAAREDRLWEKRAAAYEETLSAVLYRRERRGHLLRNFRYDEATEQKLRDFFDGYEAPSWFDARARLVAYASEAVMDAFEASARAEFEVWGHYQARRELVDANRQAAEAGNLGAVDAEAPAKEGKQVKSALEEAEAADRALVKLIRDELRSRPEAAMLPVPAPRHNRRGMNRALPWRSSRSSRFS